MDFKEKLFLVSKNVGTPFYIVYPEVFNKNITSFLDACKSQYDKFILSYSFKTNYSPFILNAILANDCYAEVVSTMEYDLALDLGFKGENIIFNGPIKKKIDLKKAVLNHSIIHLDGEYEVHSLLDIVRELNLKNVKVGLRVNMEINTNNGHSAIQAGLKESRFGFTIQMLDYLVPLLKANNIIINSLHGHTSSINRLVDNYQIIAKRLLDVCEKFDLDNIEYLDLGGGFFGAAPRGINVSNKPTYLDYAKGIMDVFSNNLWFLRHKPNLIIEPGTSVVTNTFDLVTKVYQHKHIGDKNFVVLDASVFHVKPINGVVNYPFEIFSNNPEQQAIITDFVGSTCMEIDKISKDVEINHYRNGDLVVFKGEGAYMMNMTPSFINFQIPIVTLSKDGSFTYIRKRQTLNQLKDVYNI